MKGQLRFQLLDLGVMNVSNHQLYLFNYRKSSIKPPFSEEES